MTKYKISEIGEVVGGGTPSTKYKEYYSTNKDISWITPKDLSGYTKMYISNGERYITSKGLNNSSAKMLPKDTILISSRAPIGYVAIAQKELATNQGFKSIIPDKTKILPEFLYFTMITKKSELENIATGSTFKEVSGKVMKNFEIDVPTIEKQKKIIDKLIPIVRKIELNNEINTNLEEINKLYFSNIFKNTTNFIKASDIAEIKIGKTPPRKEKKWFSSEKGQIWVSIKDMNSSGSFILDSSEYLINNATNNFNIQKVSKNTVILSFKLTIGRVKITEQDMFTNEAIAQFKNAKLPFQFLYTYLKSFPYETLGSTSSIAKSINSKIVKNIPILHPEKYELDNYMSFAEPIFKEIELHQLENKKLLSIKDELLHRFFN